MKNHCKDSNFYVIKHSFRAQIPKFNIFYYLRGGGGTEVGWIFTTNLSNQTNLLGSGGGAAIFEGDKKKLNSGDEPIFSIH